MMLATLPRRREITRPAAVIVEPVRRNSANYNIEAQVWSEGLGLDQVVYPRHVEGFSVDETSLPSIRCVHVNINALPENCILTYISTSSSLLLVDTQRPPRPKVPDAPVLASVGVPMMRVKNARKMSLSLECAISKFESQLALFTHSLYRAPLCFFVRVDAQCPRNHWRTICDESTKSVVLYWTDQEPDDGSSAETVADALYSLMNVVEQITLHNPPEDVLLALPRLLDSGYVNMSMDRRPTEFSVILPENRAEELDANQVEVLARAVNGVLFMHSFLGDTINGSVKLDFTGPENQVTIGMAGMSSMYLGNHLIGYVPENERFTKLRLEISALSVGRNDPPGFAKPGRTIEIAIGAEPQQRDFEDDLNKLARASVAYDAFLRAADVPMVIYPNPNRKPPRVPHPEMDEETFRFTSKLVRYHAYLPIPFGFDIDFTVLPEEERLTSEMAIKRMEDSHYRAPRLWETPRKIMDPVPLIKAFVPSNWPTRTWVLNSRRPASQV